MGTTAKAQGGELTLTIIKKHVNYGGSPKEYRDPYVNSPKSANIHPDGTKYYVNSLEGCATVVYDMKTHERLKVIKYDFKDGKDDALWSKPSQFYPFTHYTHNLNTFQGKPVEATFSHGGRYLWIPFYRRTYDLNAQDPSAVAVIDTKTDQIVKLMETGPLPKMVATSHDGKHVAITHWGNNTVGLVNVASLNPDEWFHEKLLVVDYVLPLNFSLKESVDRDNKSGYCLRGTVFTPDDKYLLVGCMGGNGGIAVINMETQEYLGRVLGMMANVRHLVIRDGYLYLSVNKAGYVQRIKLDKFMAAAKAMAENYNYDTIVDTIVCMDGMEVIGAYLAEELSRAGIHSMNAHKTIYIVSPEFDGTGNMIFRDNNRGMIRGKYVLLLIASATTGRTIARAVECINYYGGSLAGISAIYSAATKIFDRPINALFTIADIPDYKTYRAEVCPMCKNRVKIDAICNGYGYSEL